MRTRRPPDRDAALSRRLSQLSDELSAHHGGVRPARPEHVPRDLTAEPWWDDHTRLAPSRHEPPAPTGPPPVASVSPPGRHLAPRRTTAGLGPLWGAGAAQLAVVAVVVAVGLAATCWWLLRGSAHTGPELAAAPAQGQGLVSLAPVAGGVEPVGTDSDDAEAPASTAGPSAASPSGAGARTATVTVDVAGKVRHPGIVVLDGGARVVDALQAAGGARPGVDLVGLNLARVLVDGEQIVVGQPQPAGAGGVSPPSTDPSGSATGPPTLVDLNTATETELDSLPEVGPVTAASILQWRDQHGGFSSVDELLEVDGIGEATLGKLEPYVTV